MREKFRYVVSLRDELGVISNRYVWGINYKDALKHAKQIKKRLKVSVKFHSMESM